MNLPRLHLVALDCPNPYALAQFYSSLTGIDLVHDVLPALSFQKVENYVAPNWPEGEIPQQIHLDFEVDDLDEGEKHALSVGARKADFQPGETFRVFLDPVGHPFCLILKND